MSRAQRSCRPNDLERRGDRRGGYFPLLLRGLVGLWMLVAVPLTAFAQSPDDEGPFSGPQPGESLPSTTVRDLLADPAETFALPLSGTDKGELLIFIHERTRPSIGLTRAIVDGWKRLPEPRPGAVVVFLTDDPTATMQWGALARNALPTDVRLGVSTDGPEGPGNYGLNRETAMTVLIAAEGKVTANFAPVQPSVAADLSAILTALAQAAGVSAESLMPEPTEAAERPGGRPAADDEAFRNRMRPLLDRSKTADEIAMVAADIEAACRKDAALARRVGDVARRIVSAGVLGNYGNEHAQAVLQRWSETLGKDDERNR